MINLVNNFSPQEIIMVGAALFVALFEIYKARRELKKDARNSHAEYHSKKKREEEIEKRINDCEDAIGVLKSNQDFIMQQNQLLTESDKIRIKAEIVKQHHYFCYKKGYIDEFSLDSLERQFDIYRYEGGNSFVENLMEDLRDLPIEPPDYK